MNLREGEPVQHSVICGARGRTLDLVLEGSVLYPLNHLPGHSISLEVPVVMTGEA